MIKIFGVLILFLVVGGLRVQPFAQTVPSPADHASLTFHQTPKSIPSGAVTEDWPTFLGLNHNAVSGETGLLKDWPDSGPSLVWEMHAGKGYSSPSVVGDNLVFFHRVGDQEVVECLESDTGKRFWRFAYPSDYEDRYGYSNGPRASPVMDGDKVFTLGVQGRLHCLNLGTGEVLWERDLAEDYQLVPGFFGIGTTPLVEGGLLIVNVGAVDGPNVVAFDKTTGNIAWSAGGEWGSSYASPIPADIQGKRRILVFAGGERSPPVGGLLSLDPIVGKIDFRFPWRSRTYESVNAASPVAIGNRVFISASYRMGSAMLSVDSSFGYSVEWETDEIGFHFNTAIHRDGYLYAFDGRNRGDASLVCVDAKTGQVVWRDVLEWKENYTVQGPAQEHTLSPYRGTLLLADGHFLCLGESGHLLWLDLSPKGHRILARSWLFAAPESWTPPVVSRGLLYIVQNQRDTVSGKPPRLLCYDLRAAE